MKAYVLFDCDVPDNVISEQLDWYVGALDQLRQELINNTNPCLNGSNIKVLTTAELFNLTKK